ncbi:MAG: hypothetical protein IT377_05360 [Polyangiaceae bacterium]|nr:hypothetical protein [Polyangiaceae bacterium]
MRFAFGISALCTLLATGCGGDPEPCSDCDGTRLVMDLAADLTKPERFYDVPYPSDLRLDADGHPILDGFPNPNEVFILGGLAANAEEAKGFPVIPVAHLRFTAPLAVQSSETVIAADAGSPVLLLDVDAASPERGRLVPTLAESAEPDLYTAENVLSVAARPGFVLRPHTRYAVVVQSQLGGADGRPLAQASVLARLAKRAPRGEAEQRADELYAPLWETLDTLGVERANVAGATVFTTGDVVAEQAALSQAVVDAYDVTLTGLKEHVDAALGELCVLEGNVEYPQFQAGKPPYNTEGHFVLGGDGLPVLQRKETAPIKIVLPKTPMPPGGYPLMVNIHGSGGFSIAMARPVGDDGQPGGPIGPAFPYAAQGIAMAGSAMPLNPERFPGASETAYLNANNLAAMRDTFRQGQIELRLFVEALAKLKIEPVALGTCTGPTLPTGVTHFRFDPKKLLVTGQSMGGMYTNMLAATEPSLLLAVPTGAGGLWPHFIVHTPLQGGKFTGFLKLLLGTDVKLTHLHPVLGLGAAALEAADPFAYAPRIARRPLPGHPVRPVFDPVAPDDSYFAQLTYDAIALAYGHQQAGAELWPAMQQALALNELDGLLPFPVMNNRKSEGGAGYTGVVAQYAPKALPGEAKADGHAIYSHRDDLKFQYACFAASFLMTGSATLLAPKADWTAACP